MQHKTILLVVFCLLGLFLHPIIGKAESKMISISSSEEWDIFLSQSDSTWDNHENTIHLQEETDVTISLSEEISLKENITFMAPPSTTITFDFTNGQFTGMGHLLVSDVSSVIFSGEMVSHMEVSNTNVSWTQSPSQNSLGILDSIFTEAPITVTPNKPIPFILKDSSLTNSPIMTPRTTTVLIDGVTLDHSDVHINTIRMGADVPSHQILDSTWTDSSLILEGETSGGGVFTFQQLTSYDNTKGLVTYNRPSTSANLGFLAMRLNEVHAYRCKESPTKFVDVSMGCYISYIRNCSFEGTTEASDKTGLLVDYGGVEEINGLTVDHFGTGISIQYGNVRGDAVQAVGDTDKLITSGYTSRCKASWQDFHIKNCTNGVAANYQSFFSADSEIFDFSIEGIEDNTTGEGFVMYNGLSDSNLTDGPEYLIPKGNLYIHDGDIKNFKIGMHCYSSSAWYVDNIAIQNVNQGLYAQNSIAGIFRRMHIMNGVGENNQGLYTTSATDFVLLDGHIDNFKTGGYTDSGVPLIIGGTIENCDVGLTTYHTAIYGVKFIHNKIGWKQRSAPNSLGFCLFDGQDKENAIGIDLNNIGTRACVGVSDVFVLYPEANTKEGEGCFENYNYIKQLASISETYSDIKKFEIKNCKIGIDANGKSGAADVAAVSIHDCQTGMNLPNYQSYFGGGVEVYNCDIGCYFGSIYTISNIMAKDESVNYPVTFRDCKIGMKQNKEENGTILTSGMVSPNYPAILFEQCEIGFYSALTLLRQVPLGFVDNEIGWKIPNEYGETKVNSWSPLLYLKGNEVGVDAEEDTLPDTGNDFNNFTADKLYMRDNEIGLRLTGRVYVNTLMDVKNSDIEIANEHGLLIIGGGASKDNALTFTVPDTSLQETGRFVATGKTSSQEAVKNAEITNEGLVLNPEDPGIYRFTPKEGGGHQHDDKFISGSPGDPGSNWYLVIHSGCYVNYDYETNGGESWTGDNTRVSYLDGEEIDISYTAERTGYRFLGWSLSPDNATGLVEEPLFAETEEITLYAIFEKIVTVTYDYETNGGTGISSPTELAPANSYETKPGVPVNLTYTGLKADYAFVGWNTNPEAHTGLSELITEEEDIILYAIYERTYTITYHAYQNTFSEEYTIYNNDVYAYSYADYALKPKSVEQFRYYQPRGTSEQASPGDTMSSYYTDVDCYYDIEYFLRYVEYTSYYPPALKEIARDTHLYQDKKYDELDDIEQTWNIKEYADCLETEVPKDTLFQYWYQFDREETISHPGDTLKATAPAMDICAEIKYIKTEAPTITVSDVYQVTLTPGNIENDTLDTIYYRINGGDYMEYTKPFPVYKDYTIEAYQTTTRGISSDTAKVTGREKPIGITATYNGGDKELFERVIPEEVTVTLHYPNSPDETTTDFTLRDDVIMKEGPNTVTAVYQDSDEMEPLTDSFPVNGVLPKHPKTAPPVITVSPDCKVTIAAGPIQDDLLDTIYYRINGGAWTAYTDIFPVYGKYQVDAYQTTKLYALSSEIATVSGTEYPTGITATYTGDDKPVGDTVSKSEVTVTVHYPNSPDKETTDFTLEDTEITHPGLNEVTVHYTEYPDDPKCPTYTTTVSVNGVLPPEPPKVTTDPPTITVQSDYKVSLTPGAIQNDTLDHIYYRINGGDWHIYKDLFPVYKTFTVEAYQTTKREGVKSDIVKQSGREYPSGITAEYIGDLKDIGETVPPEEIIVTVHYPNSPDETTTDFTLTDDVITKEGPNTVTVHYTEYPDDPECPTYTTTVEVIGVKTPDEPSTEPKEETSTETTTEQEKTTEVLTTEEKTTEVSTTEVVTTTEATTDVPNITEEVTESETVTEMVTEEETTEEETTENSSETITEVKTGDEGHPLLVLCIFLLSTLGFLFLGFRKKR